MKKIFYILKAWIKALGWATSEDIMLSKHRIQICKKCAHKRSNWFYKFCNICGCPIYPKSFSTSKETDCPLKKW